MSSDKLKIAAYCRVSTEKSDQVNSLLSQKNYFSEYISNHGGWELADIYADEGISGTSIKKRTDFNRMIADAKNKKIDLILTKEVSRFARNTVDTLRLTRELKSAGVGVIFINDNINTLDAEGEFRLTIMASVAQEESRKTSERVKWGQRRRMEQGVVFGRDMLGYFVKNGKLIINPEEAETVKLIYHKFLNEGKGVHVIAKELRESGITPKRSGNWNNTVILRVLKNEKYTGDLLQKKTYTPDYLTHTKKYNNSEDKIYIKNHHEPIIDRTVWNDVQKELSHRSPKGDHKSKYSNRYWCSGKIFCGECGAAFVSRTKTLQSGKYKAWRCYNSAVHGSRKQNKNNEWIGCGSHSVNEKVLYFCAGYAVNYILTDKDMLIKSLTDDIKSIQKSASPNTATYKNRIAAIKKDKENLIKLRLQNEIGREDFMMVNSSYDKDIASLKKKIADSEYKPEDINSFTVEIENMLNFSVSADRDCIYRETLERIVVCDGNLLNIYLKSLPFTISVRYSASGRADNYTVAVNEIYLSQ